MAELKKPPLALALMMMKPKPKDNNDEVVMELRMLRKALLDKMNEVNDTPAKTYHGGGGSGE